MIKNLVIVESPAKAKTIEKYLGPDFKVTSSMGHVRDLPKGDGAIDIAGGFKPKYEVSPDKKKLVSELKKLSKQAEMVWLATDEDREGEAISWHLFEELGLKESNSKRIVFNEITKTAILNAVANPRTIDRHLVDAQQARRVLDRLVGFELSPILWRKVKPSLSAGRVQSVTVRLVVEREREILDFTAQSDFRVQGFFTTSKGAALKAESKLKFNTAAEVEAFLENHKQAEFRVSDLQVAPAFRSPAPPFTTSTLQQEASRKLGYDVSRTMQLAQKLYENGHITYMRTDSTNLSQLALNAAKEEVISQYGEAFSHTRQYATKNHGAQEAHEAIRPTFFSNHSAGSNPQERKLYELIWKRSIASQMSKAELEKTTISLDTANQSAPFKVEGEVIRFEGFLKVYLEGRDDEEDEEQSGLLPAVQVGESLIRNSIKATQRYQKPKPRYTEASLVKKLEELGIGRPSTYAPTISTVQKRGYVVQENREPTKRSIECLELTNEGIEKSIQSENFGQERNKLFPTDIGSLVTDFLLAHFDQIMDFGFTASVEKQFDEIAQGMKAWQDMLTEFYGPFHSTVAQTADTAERVTGERVLGEDPKSGLPILTRMGRYGALVQKGDKDSGVDPVFASLQAGQTLETITLEEALKLFELPREVCVIEGEPVTAAVGRYGPYLKFKGKFFNVPADTDLIGMTESQGQAIMAEFLSQPQYPLEVGTYNGHALLVNKGRFGPYVKYDKLFASIPKGEDPSTITQERAIQLVEAKLKGEKAAALKELDAATGIVIVDGRYGPYIKQDKVNAPIPKGTDWKEVTLEQAQEWLKEAASKKKAPAKKRK